MEILALPAALAYLIFCAVCAAKESKVTGLYKTFGVYGRVAAYFSLFCPLGIIMFIVSFFIDAIPVAQGFLFLILSVFGAFIIWNAYRKCPAFLKKKLIPSMILSGFGVTIKICLFFLVFVWKLTGPQEMKDESGNTVYVYGGDVYDGSGRKIGVASSDRQSYIRTEQ